MPKAFLFNGIITLQKLFGGYMKNVLVVIDMQNDFIDGSLGTKEACKTVDPVIR